MLTQLLSRATIEGSDGLWQDAVGSDFERSSVVFRFGFCAESNK